MDERQRLHFKYDQFSQETYVTEGKGVCVWKTGKETNDVSQVLSPKESQEYQQFVGIARWFIELGRVDILYELSLLSSHLDMPQK